MYRHNRWDDIWSASSMCCNAGEKPKLVHQTHTQFGIFEKSHTTFLRNSDQCNFNTYVCIFPHCYAHPHTSAAPFKYLITSSKNNVNERPIINTELSINCNCITPVQHGDSPKTAQCYIRMSLISCAFKQTKITEFYFTI